MRRDNDVINAAQSLGELMGHDILLMTMADPLAREAFKAEVGTEHVPVRRWFSALVKAARSALPGVGAEPDGDAGCRSTSPSRHAGRPAGRAASTSPLSRQSHASPPRQDGFARSALT